MIKNFEFGQHLVVKVGVGQRHYYFFFDFILVVDKVVMSESLVGALGDKMPISAIADSKCMHSSL
jgi:hypothetical protein